MSGSLTILPLGPGMPEHLTLGAINSIRNACSLILRTERHPVSDWLHDNGIEYTSLDYLYEECSDFNDLNIRIAKSVIENAENVETVYAVPDPLTDMTVPQITELAGEKGLRCVMYPGLSYADELLASGQINGTYGISLISASSFVSEHNTLTNLPLIIFEIDNRIMASEVKLTLNKYLNDKARVRFFPPSERYPREFSELTLSDIDRQNSYDHTAAVYIPVQPENEIPQLSGRRILKMISASKDNYYFDSLSVHEHLSSLMKASSDKISVSAVKHDYDGMTKELANMIELIFRQISAGEVSGNITLEDVNNALLQRIMLDG